MEPLPVVVSRVRLRAPLLEIAVAADDSVRRAVSVDTRLPFGYAIDIRRCGANREQQFSTIIDPRTELLDPWFSSGVAASTTSFAFATGIYIAPCVIR